MTEDGRQVIMISKHEDGAKVEPVDFLGPRFNDYREAVSRNGATYVAALKANVLSIDRLASIHDALEEAGFAVAVAEDLRDSLKLAAEQAHGTVEEGKRSIKQVTERLKKLGLSLFPFQRDGVRWLAPRRFAALLDEMGLGKTIQVLCALPADAATLVVAPVSVASSWVSETKKWRPDITASFQTGKANFRWPERGELIVTTYGSLPEEDQGILLPPAGMVLVADEAHMLKGSPGRKVKIVDEETGEESTGYKGGTIRVRRWNGLRDVVDECGGKIWLLTGTPLLNRPNELWRVLQAANLAMEAFGSYPQFTSMFGGQRGRYGMEWDGGVSEDAPLALQKVGLRRDRAKVLPDLPLKRRQISKVKISDADAIRRCDELTALLEANDYTVDDLADMSQLANDVRAVVFSMLSAVRAGLAAAKIPAMLEWIKDEYEEEEIPLVVFSAHSAPLKALSERDGWELIDGSVPAEKRGDIVDRFQAGELKGVACQYQAGGTGITLTHANHVMLVDLPWTPALVKQAEDRCCRIGQEADSIHVRILAADHPVDERVAELILEKTALIEASVEAAAVETVQVDDVAAREAATLARLAEETSEIAAQAEAQAKKRKEEKAKRERYQARWSRGEFNPLEADEFRGYRPPADEFECFVAAAICQLADDDPDHAGVHNNIGFSGYDSEFGHSLARGLREYGRLSEKQWDAAKRLSHKYRRQVGIFAEGEVV